MKQAVVDAATTTPVYCNNPDYNYYYCDDESCPYECPGRLQHTFYSDDATCPDPWWDDLDILCRTYSLSEIVRKTGDEG
jgi:hypothetical protein